MKTITPSGRFAQYPFTCPNPECRFTYWYTEKQLTNTRMIIKCDCGEEFKPRLEIEEPKKKESKTDLNKSRQFLIAVNFLISTGKQEKIATEIVTSVYSPTKSLEELIRDSLNHGR